MAAWYACMASSHCARRWWSPTAIRHLRTPGRHLCPPVPPALASMPVQAASRARQAAHSGWLGRRSRTPAPGRPPGLLPAPGSRAPAAHSPPRQRRLPNQPLAPGHAPARPVTSAPSGAALLPLGISRLRCSPQAHQAVVGAQRPEHHHRNQDPEQGGHHIQGTNKAMRGPRAMAPLPKHREERERRSNKKRSRPT